MKIITNRKQLLGLLCILPLLIFSCKKDEADPLVSLRDGKSTVIEDLAGDTQAAMGGNTPGKEQRDFYTFLFRFKDQKQIWIRNKEDADKWLKTKDWDLAFTGPYNSEVFINNNKFPYNPGFGGPAEGAVLLIRQPYEQVDLAPTEEEFKNTEVNKIGWASSSESNGWFFYSLNTHLMQPIKNQTYVIKLPDGKFAKLQLINAYKGNPPSVTDLNWPAPYFTFRYYVQQDGSRNISTRK